MIEKYDSVPNFFYDFIVFFTPTIGFAIGVSFGLTGNFMSLEKTVTQLGPLGTVTLALILIFASYEFGRLAETFSDLFVGKVISLFGKIGLFSSKDFRKSLAPQVASLPLDISLLEGRSSSKWTIYFFASAVSPRLGSDLLKRYAWEKLARSSGFTVLLLLIISIVTAILTKVGLISFPIGTFTFGGVGYTIGCFVFYILLLIDYYKRNCWNNDLLITTVPVLLAYHQAQQKAQSNDINAELNLRQGLGRTKKL